MFTQDAAGSAGELWRNGRLQVDPQGTADGDGEIDMTKVGRAGLAALCLIATSSAGVAQPYGPGVTDTEIKFGNIMP
ncbi:MAG: hypothetical protein JWR73_2741 [Tardiphaga sp.]|nr:hypothetical protein [Tardiphaga sp.]